MSLNNPSLVSSERSNFSSTHSRLKITYIIGIVASILASNTVYAADQATESTTTPSDFIVFNNNNLPSDLTGSLEASVSFAQSQIMPSKHGIEGDIQPNLTALRTSLLMVKPKRSDLDVATPLRVTAIDKQGSNLGTISLNPPNQLPKTVYAIDNLPEGEIDFSPIEGPSTTIDSATEIAKLNDPSAVFLQQTLTTNNLVEIKTAEGVWTSDIYLPNSASMSNKVVRVTSMAGYSSKIHYSNRSVIISKGNVIIFKHINGQWVSEEEVDNDKLIYSDYTWSLKLPPNWIQPGMGNFLVS